MVFLQRVNTDNAKAGEWYVLDDDSLAIVDGPFCHRWEAERADALNVPDLFHDMIERQADED